MAKAVKYPVNYVRSINNLSWPVSESRVMIVMICATVVDCGDPGTPIHGTKWSGSTSLNSICKYMCDRGFRLVGDSFRVCQAGGTWSGALPTCQRKTIYIQTLCILCMRSWCLSAS